AGAAARAIIDRAHLQRMTLGDASLEREVLELFDRQAALLMERMRTADAQSFKMLAHTLKGSAGGVGAFDVAQAAAMVEQSEPGAGAAHEAALSALAAAVGAARAAIARILKAPQA